MFLKETARPADVLTVPASWTRSIASWTFRSAFLGAQAERHDGPPQFCLEDRVEHHEGLAYGVFAGVGVGENRFDAARTPGEEGDRPGRGDGGEGGVPHRILAPYAPLECGENALLRGEGVRLLDRVSLTSAMIRSQRAPPPRTRTESPRRRRRREDGRYPPGYRQVLESM